MLLKKMAAVKVTKNEFSERLRMTCSGISVIAPARYTGLWRSALREERAETKSFLPLIPAESSKTKLVMTLPSVPPDVFSICSDVQIDRAPGFS